MSSPSEASDAPEDDIAAGHTTAADAPTADVEASASAPSTSHQQIKAEVGRWEAGPSKTIPLFNGTKSTPSASFLRAINASFQDSPTMRLLLDPEPSPNSSSYNAYMLAEVAVVKFLTAGEKVKGDALSQLLLSKESLAQENAFKDSKNHERFTLGKALDSFLHDGLSLTNEETQGDLQQELVDKMRSWKYNVTTSFTDNFMSLKDLVFKSYGLLVSESDMDDKQKSPLHVGHMLDRLYKALESIQMWNPIFRSDNFQKFFAANGYHNNAQAFRDTKCHNWKEPGGVLLRSTSSNVTATFPKANSDNTYQGNDKVYSPPGVIAQIFRVISKGINDVDPAVRHNLRAGHQHVYDTYMSTTYLASTGSDPVYPTPAPKVLPLSTPAPMTLPKGKVFSKAQIMEAAAHNSSSEFSLQELKAAASGDLNQLPCYAYFKNGECSKQTCPFRHPGEKFQRKKGTKRSRSSPASSKPGSSRLEQALLKLTERLDSIEAKINSQ